MKVSDLIFDTILSEGTYGIVWSATVATFSRPTTVVAVKVVVLTAGVYYDRAEKCYRDGSRQNQECKSTCFNRVNKTPPFHHALYKKRKAMPIYEFLKEVEQQTQLASLGLGLKVYDSIITMEPESADSVQGESQKIIYGMIIMDIVDCSLKQVIIQRDLTAKEQAIIEDLKKRMAEVGIIHGDFKPSNLGIKFSRVALVPSTTAQNSETLQISEVSQSSTICETATIEATNEALKTSEGGHASTTESLAEVSAYASTGTSAQARATTEITSQVRTSASAGAKISTQSSAKDIESQISEIYLLDCFKVKYVKPSLFQQLMTHDLGTYERHYTKNIVERYK